jgi:hypothetical protein
MRHHLLRAALAPFLLAVGCNSRPTTLAVQGEVSFDGQPIQAGEIVFVPVDGTKGPSAFAAIREGRYAIAEKWGLRPVGVYLVRITAYTKTGRIERNPVDRGGLPVEVTENLIPEMYNSQSTLTVRVAELLNRNKVDFHVGNTPSPSPR